MNNRFDRHKIIPEWNQERLLNATVIIIGMGALGNEVSRILAMSGVGKLIVCDPDVIEESNLSRTILFRQKDIGRLKVDAAADELDKLFPEIIIDKRPQPLIHGIGLAELRDATLILGCLDSRTSRLQLAGRCQLIGAKYIDSGTHPWGGEVRPYLDPEGPCYGCGLTPEERAMDDDPWSCLDVKNESPVGSAIPSSALVGSWMGMIAVRFLMGLNAPKDIIHIDGLRGTTYNTQQTRNPECPLHVAIGLVNRIRIGTQNTFRELKEAIPKNATPLAWAPVQYKVECLRCGFNEFLWGIPKIEKCSKCRHLLSPRQTIELAEAPNHIKLEQLGIPPREILAVRTDEGLNWFELNE